MLLLDYGSHSFLEVLLNGSGLLLEGVKGIELTPWGCCGGSELGELEGLLGGLLVTVLSLLNNHWCRSRHLMLDDSWLSDGTVACTSTSGHILSSIALVDGVIEQLSIHAPVHTGTSLDAHVIDLAISGVAVEVEVGDRICACLRWASESHESLGIAVTDLVRPFATISLLAEGKSLRAIEHESTAVDAVHELSAIDAISHLKVTKLMGAFVGGLERT